MKKFIKKYYGSNKNLAKDLGITNQTVSNWITNNPRGMLKFLPEISLKVNISERQIMWEIINHENTLK
jgi:DNA-binding XRE family transcriptional regulator